MAVKSFSVFLQEEAAIPKKKGRPKKDRSNEVPKVAGKRGRPAGKEKDEVEGNKGKVIQEKRKKTKKGTMTLWPACSIQALWH